MKPYYIFLLCLLLVGNIAISQSVGVGTSLPDSSSMLEVKSTNKEFLPPRMTFAQRNAILNPAQGLVVYCTNCDTSGQLQVFNGNRWANCLGGLAATPLATNLSNITICSQIWSLHNLDVDKYSNGDLIPQVTDATAWSTLTTGAWCWFNNDSAANAATYERLYNWYAVNDPRGLAPTGWHIPTTAEWKKLTDTCLGVNSGGPMKSTGTIEGATGLWHSPNTGATNSSGFTALPAAGRLADGGFPLFGTTGLGYTCSWWSTDGSGGNADFVGISYNGPGISFSNNSANIGRSVRVVRD